MTDKRSIGIFAAGLLTAAALYGIYVWFHPMTGGDDEPIVVAGGSLDLESLNGWKKDPQDPSGYTAIHNHTKRRVTIGSIGYNNGAPVTKPLPAGRTKLELAYCSGPCDPNIPDDKVTVWTEASGNKLRVTNTNQNHKMGDEADAAAAAGSTTISHLPLDWHVVRIRDVVQVPNVDYVPADPRCHIVLIYHCDHSGQCQ